MQSFVKYNPHEIAKSLSFTDIHESCPSRDCLKLQICLNDISENKIFTKISEFTVELSPIL